MDRAKQTQFIKTLRTLSLSALTIPGTFKTTFSLGFKLADVWGWWLAWAILLASIGCGLVFDAREHSPTTAGRLYWGAAILFALGILASVISLFFDVFSPTTPPVPN